MASAPLTPEQIAYQTAHAHESKQPMIYGVCALYVVVDTIAVVLRVYARRLAKVKLSWDDYLIFLALAFGWAVATTIIVSSVYGIGKHAITLDLVNGTKMSKAMFAFEAFFPFLNTTIKLSILSFYKRIFGLMRSFQYMWYFNLLWTLGVFAGLNVAVWGQCRPISDFWELEKGHVCRMPFAASLVVNIANAVGDFLIMILPLPAIYQLQLPHRKKAGVAGIFLLGSSVLVVSALRVPMLKHGTTDTDSSWSEVDGILLSFAEPSIGMVCACLPVMWPLFKRGVSHLTTRGRTVMNSRGDAWSGSNSKQWSSLGDEERALRPKPDIKVLHNVEISYGMQDLRTSSQASKEDRPAWRVYQASAENVNSSR